MTNQRFEALSRICLNNWHYIRHKTLSFHEGINFFTGHSGSGKSTVIDAMQIVLYANTDGRGFFNKAAADDSDRSLIEYLRGMVNIGEDNQVSYLRNADFSSTIVLEFRQTDTGECQCIGVVFDVETASNQISKMFFWHKGTIPGHHYRDGNDGSGRALSSGEVKQWLLGQFTKETCYFGSHNERFRRQLYDIYLGGLDGEKFPLLFKRAIPFRMNIKLEEFVKEYICTEQDIHIEDMQISVMEYGRMRRKIEDICGEIARLKEICSQYGQVEELEKQLEAYRYYASKLDIMQSRLLVSECQEKIQALQENREKTARKSQKEQEEIQRIEEESDELLRRISNTGYEQLKGQLSALNDLLEHLKSSRARWQQTAGKLKAWEEEDCISNRTLWDIDAFIREAVSEEELERLKGDLDEVKKDVSGQLQNAKSELSKLLKREKESEEELAQLKAGKKAYPKELEQAVAFLQTRLYQETGKSIKVIVLADLLDIRDEAWREAVEGYLSYHKLTLLVEPKYARLALSLYEEMDKKKYFRVAVLDSEKVLADRPRAEAGSLAEEVEAKDDYARAYVDFLLGKVIKCENREELREHRTGITRDCVVYHNYRIQHINPAFYTTAAYIGKSSVRQRARLLEEEQKETQDAVKKNQELVRNGERLLKMEYLSQDLPVYLEWKQDMAACREKEKEQEALRDKMEKLLSQNVEQWQKDREALISLCGQKREVLRQLQRKGDQFERDEKRERDNLIRLHEEVMEKEKGLEESREYEEKLRQLLAEKPASRYDLLRNDILRKAEKAEEKKQQETDRLLELRTGYLREYQHRNFSPTSKENREYQELLDQLNDHRLEEFRAKAAEQARTAMEHFKDDFMYKIRSAIKEALQRRDELNRVISRLDFGKDKYQFYIGKNKGPDGQYYDMFMDEALEINPSELDIGLDNQLNLFTVEHENHYGTMINDLISIFIPPENATAQELEEARRNMDKYADYRTYLSFDMQQLIQNDGEVIKISLSKMIKKNSGGEGQNPLYVALLASFAQAYKIDLSPGMLKNPTIRLVVLDEAFSKMDGEKVASCIQLIRGLGFQALISATNDKIQNYLENVDKIFVFANPNKKAISIQEFEQKEFGELKEE